MSETDPNHLPLDDLETVDDDSVKTIYIDGYWGVSITDRVLKINLYEIKTSPSATPISKKHIVARLAVPIPSFFKIADAFDQLSKEIKELIEKNAL
jgi:hypothetical protein